MRQHIHGLMSKAGRADLAWDLRDRSPTGTNATRAPLAATPMRSP
jgi:hypothetical protein